MRLQAFFMDHILTRALDDPLATQGELGHNRSDIDTTRFRDEHDQLFVVVVVVMVRRRTPDGRVPVRLGGRRARGGEGDGGADGCVHRLQLGVVSV